MKWIYNTKAENALIINKKAVGGYKEEKNNYSNTI